MNTLMEMQVETADQVEARCKAHNIGYGEGIRGAYVGVLEHSYAGPVAGAYLAGWALGWREWRENQGMGADATPRSGGASALTLLSI